MNVNSPEEPECGDVLIKDSIHPRSAQCDHILLPTDEASLTSAL